MKTRRVYASWGSDKNYRWLWRAALQDAIFAFKLRYKSGVARTVNKPVDGGFVCTSEDGVTLSNTKIVPLADIGGGSSN